MSSLIWNGLKFVWCVGAVIQTVEWAQKKLTARPQSWTRQDWDTYDRARGIDSVETQLDIMIHTREIETAAQS